MAKTKAPARTPHSYDLNVTVMLPCVTTGRFGGRVLQQMVLLRRL